MLSTRKSAGKRQSRNDAIVPATNLEPLALVYNDTPVYPHIFRLAGGSDADTNTNPAGQSPLLNRSLPPAARMTDASNHSSSTVGSARERELYRYYQPTSRNEKNTRQRSLAVLPDDDTVSADGATSPDNTLTALAQLTAIRLNAQRAMVR